MSIDDYKHGNPCTESKQPFRLEAQVEVVQKPLVLPMSIVGNIPAYALPTKGRETDAGWDLYAAEDVRLFPLLPVKIHTGTAVSIPRGHVGLILDRSGLGSKGIHHLAGVVDTGYVGELLVALVSLNWRHIFGYKIKRGNRIAQLVIAESPITVQKVTNDLGETDRGTKGFGSSGK